MTPCQSLLAATALFLAATAARSDEVGNLEFMPDPLVIAETKDVYDVMLTPDGKYLVTGSDQFYGRHPDPKTRHPGIALWDVEGGKLMGRAWVEAPSDFYPNGSGPRVRSLGLSADGKTLLAYMESRHFELLSFPDLKPIAVVDVKKSPRHWYRSSAFSPDGAWLALGDSEGNVALWSVAERKLLKTWEAHDKAVEHLAFAPDSKSLASGGDDQAVRLWSVPAGKEQREIDDLEGSVIGLKYSPDGRQIAIGARFKGSGGKVFVWDVAEREMTIDRQCLVLLPAVRFAFSPDSRRIAYSCSIFMEGGDSIVRIIELAGNKLVDEIHRKTMTNGLAYAPDGKAVITVQKNPRDSTTPRQSIALWALEPVKFLRYIGDPSLKP